MVLNLRLLCLEKLSPLLAVFSTENLPLADEMESLRFFLSFFPKYVNQLPSFRSLFRIPVR